MLRLPNHHVAVPQICGAAVLWGLGMFFAPLGAILKPAQS